MSLAKKLSLILFSIFTFTGCDTASLIERNDDNLTKFPESECIEKVLKNTSDIEFKEHKIRSSSSDQSYYYWIIDGSERFIATISLNKGNHGNMKYSNGYGTLNRHLTDREKKVVPLALAKVDASIRQTCGVEINSSLNVSN